VRSRIAASVVTTTRRVPAEPAITCIIPARDAERYLAQAIDSVLGQTSGPPELLVIDDGSTDSTATVAAAYGAALAVLRQPPQGRAAACNAGLRAARGEFIAFLDADDLWHPEKLARQLAIFRARPAVEYCLTAIQNFISPELLPPGAVPIERALAVFRPQTGFALPTLLARRRLFDRVGEFRATLAHAHDTEWFLRARALGAEFAPVDEVLVHRRLHRGNMSQAQAASSQREYLSLVRAVLAARRAGTETVPP
jgi:glycosyltransferase involved in cell wall biosynthesis